MVLTVGGRIEGLFADGTHTVVAVGTRGRLVTQNARGCWAMVRTRHGQPYNYLGGVSKDEKARLWAYKQAGL